MQKLFWIFVHGLLTTMSLIVTAVMAFEEDLLMVPAGIMACVFGVATILTIFEQQ